MSVVLYISYSEINISVLEFLDKYKVPLSKKVKTKIIVLDKITKDVKDKLDKKRIYKFPSLQAGNVIYTGANEIIPFYKKMLTVAPKEQLRTTRSGSIIDESKEELDNGDIADKMTQMAQFRGRYDTSNKKGGKPPIAAATIETTNKQSSKKNDDYSPFDDIIINNIIDNTDTCNVVLNSSNMH